VTCIDNGRRRRALNALFRTTIILALALVWNSIGSVAVTAQDRLRELVSRTIDNENLYRSSSEHFSFSSRETSARTGGHVWVEKSVEIESGILRRLIAVDGTPLSAEKTQSEDRRIANLVAHPDEFRKANRAFKTDEKSLEELSHVIPRAFTFSYDGYDQGCTRIRFQPDPGFTPANYQQRAMAALAGTILIKEPDDRLCGVDARISHPVEFGFGLLGKLDENGHVHVVRIQTSGGNWQASLINVSLAGRILLFKSITQSHDEIRTDLKDIPSNLTLAQAAEMVKPQP
jgi:hypothetical protein